MLRSRIIPYLLLRGGGLVKTQMFKDYKYVGDPINAVKIFNEKEVDELSIADIDASSLNQDPDLKLLKVIAAESRMPLCYGGGVRDTKTASKIISLGFEKVSVSHAALMRPELVKEMADAIGRQSVVVTIDVRKEVNWRQTHKIYSCNATYKHELDPIDFAQKCVELGAGEIVFNSIDRDGMMQGYDLDFIRRLRAAVTTPLTVVGGAGSIDDLRTLTSEFNPIGVGVGSLFVFKGKYRAVLINYSRP